MSKKLLMWGTGSLCYQVVRNLCEENLFDTFEGLDREELKRETEGEFLRVMDDTIIGTSRYGRYA